jgi:hypothetical protein
VSLFFSKGVARHAAGAVPLIAAIPFVDLLLEPFSIQIEIGLDFSLGDQAHLIGKEDRFLQESGRERQTLLQEPMSVKQGQDFIVRAFQCASLCSEIHRLCSHVSMKNQEPANSLRSRGRSTHPSATIA